jgi:hypothetical protein
MKSFLINLWEFISAVLATLGAFFVIVIVIAFIAYLLKI